MWDTTEAYTVQEASRELNHFTEGDEARILKVEDMWAEFHSGDGT